MKKEETKLRYMGKCLLLGNGKERVLVIGDLHLGYGEVLNRSGVLVSRQMFKEVISELDEVFEGIGGKVDKVVLLGDVKHDFGRILKQEWSDVLGLLDYLSGKCKKIVLIRGNHDTVLRPIARKRGLHVRNYWKWKEFCFTHGDEDYEEIWKDKDVEFLIVGHGHPALRLKEGARREKYKCFLTGRFGGKTMIVVPSFSEWYAGSDPREGEVVLAWDVNFGNFEVRAVGEKLGVLDFGKLKRIKDR